MYNNKLISAKMTNDFFEQYWCNEFEREALLKKKVLVDREFFNNTNATGENLKFKFMQVNESKKAKIFEKE
jgi:hypothetical protein